GGSTCRREWAFSVRWDPLFRPPGGVTREKADLFIWSGAQQSQMDYPLCRELNAITDQPVFSAISFGFFGTVDSGPGPGSRLPRRVSSSRPPNGAPAAAQGGATTNASGTRYSSVVPIP